MERSMADTINTTTLPATRRQIEQHIDSLIDLLDQIDGDSDIEPDPDLEDGSDDEPSLGWSAGFMPELQRQEGRGFYMNENRGQDLEDEHDGREPSEDPEPDVDAEHSLGWGTGDSQTGQWTIVTDLEGGAGAVRKKRPASKTGGKVYRGCAILI
jgi:hypothetical protein